MNYGIMSIVTLAGGISTALLWSMSANDPYWRLVETTSVPAPAYRGAADLRAMLATVPPELGNTDAGAINPAADPMANAGRASFPLENTIRESDAASMHEPMIAVVPPLAPEPMTGPEIDAMIAYELPRTAVPVPTEFGVDADLVVARAPQPLPAPAVLRDSEVGVAAPAAVLSALDRFMVPATPAQPHVAASEDTENVLALQRRERVDVQRRLALAGFDPNGIDGFFGAQTRGAITDFQTAWGFPATGYLDASVVAELNERTEEAYQALRRQAAAAPSAAPDLAPAARERQLASVETEGSCARRPDGRIIEHQSLACDIAGFSETFVSLGRNTLEFGEDGSAVAAAGAER